MSFLWKVLSVQHKKFQEYQSQISVHLYHKQVMENLKEDLGTHFITQYNVILMHLFKAKDKVDHAVLYQLDAGISICIRIS